MISPSDSFHADTDQVHLAILGNGSNYHIQKWVRVLLEEGLRITLITFHRPANPIPGVSLHVMKPRFSRSAETMSWIDFWGSPRVLRRFLVESRVDVLLASYATNYGLLGMRTGFRPQMLQTWTYDVSVYPCTGWRKFVFRPVVKRVLSRADVVATDGDALAAFVRKNYPLVGDKIVSLFWGISLPDFSVPPDLRAASRRRLCIPEDAPTVLSPRGIDRRYSPVTVLGALAQLLERRENVHAVILTAGHTAEAEIAARVDALRASDRVHVLDRFLDREEMKAVWAASDVFVSVPPEDGISVAVLEGMYCGVLPVVSDIPSNRSFLTDGSAMFVPHDRPDELAAALEAICEDPEHYREWRNVNRQWVELNADVKRTARKLADIVRELSKAYRPSAGPSKAL